MKHFKLITITLSLIFISLGNFASSQVRLPLSSGSYKVLTDTYYDKVEVVGQKITTYKNGSLVGTFIAVEERLGQYILEIVKPGIESVDTNPKRDRKLIVAKVDYLSENECRLTLTQPNGTREKVTIQKQ
jgi:hypothetical protein